MMTMMPSKFCAECGAEFSMLPGQRLDRFRIAKYCSETCAKTVYRRNRNLSRAEGNARWKHKKQVAAYQSAINAEGKREKAEFRGFVDYDSTLNHPDNIKQRSLDRQIDEKHNIKLETKVYTKAEISAINAGTHPLAAQITPLEKIKSSREPKYANIHADLDPSYQKRRWENREEL